MTTNTRNHLSAFDGFRFFCFLSIFLYHALWPGFGWAAPLRVGVPLFFTLSGFLIGGILLKMRDSEKTLAEKLKTFYIRRSLRIFPIYYLLLGIIALASALKSPFFGGGQHLGWSATYLLNMKEWSIGHLIDGQGHLWSLCVEEQFYLLAPLALLLLPYRGMQIGFIILWIAVLIAKLLSSPTGMAYALMPMESDYLTMGIAAAMIERDGHFLGIQRDLLLRAGLVAAVLWFIGICLFREQEYYLSACLLPLASAALVSALWRRQWHGVDALLSWRPLVYLGAMTYGLYLYHPYALKICDKIAAIGWEHPIRHSIAALALTIVVAALSWHLIESPINRLKDRF